MWYASSMPALLPKENLQAADAAIAFAQQVRRYHRRRTSKGSKQRTDDIAAALERLKVAMAPLRSEIGRFPYGPQTDVAEENRDKIKAKSRELQSERRKLWKMS